MLNFLLQYLFLLLKNFISFESGYKKSAKWIKYLLLKHKVDKREVVAMMQELGCKGDLFCCSHL